MNEKLQEYYARVELLEFEEDERTSKHEEPENECIHDLCVIDGVATCMNCGEIHYSTLVNDFNDSQGQQIVYRPYVRIKYFRDILRRLNGYFYVTDSETDDIINKLPDAPNIKKVRNYLRKHKIHMKNDFYYWKMKNNITNMIDSNDMCEWEIEFSKLRKKKSAKDYLFEKLNAKLEYAPFADLFIRKIPVKKKIEQLKC